MAHAFQGAMDKLGHYAFSFERLGVRTDEVREAYEDHPKRTRAVTNRVFLKSDSLVTSSGIASLIWGRESQDFHPKQKVAPTWLSRVYFSTPAR